MMSTVITTPSVISDDRFGGDGAFFLFNSDKMLRYDWMHDGSPVNRLGISASCQNNYGFSSHFPKNFEKIFTQENTHQYSAALLPQSDMTAGKSAQ
ncbi:hypothetical protein HWE04_09380 [Herbaspirillum sp. C7C2]|uniref:hypothetical protein n=1 Tax=Herbaspirillum sp. C7C2 TaxID=2736666 RepID=UPI001F5179B3|nr:hypothetical protein [Herbaspirillum sp. C7C2]MCI1014065.1 hypothetical protein [Herbaspirillum sp. C7C2]